MKNNKIKNLVQNKEDYELLQKVVKYILKVSEKEPDGTLNIPVLYVQELQDVLKKSYFEELKADLLTI